MNRMIVLFLYRTSQGRRTHLDASEKSGAIRSINRSSIFLEMWIALDTTTCPRPSRNLFNQPLPLIVPLFSLTLLLVSPLFLTLYSLAFVLLPPLLHTFKKKFYSKGYAQ